MKSPATARQKQLLEVIYNYIKGTGYAPSMEEMRKSLGVSSNQSVIDLLEKLKKHGLIKRGSGARSLAILPLGHKVLGVSPLAPFLGVAAAGAPIEAVAIAGEWRTVSPEVAELKDEVFLLKISGDSMVNANIDDGDVILVQRKKEFISNEIVYAQFGEEGTVKRFISEDKPPYVYLKPENPKYENILFDETVELKGKVISVLKNGHWQPVK